MAEKGRVAEMRKKFDSGNKLKSPFEVEKEKQLEVSKAKGAAAQYNMMLRSAQVKAQKKAAAVEEEEVAGDHHVSFQVHEFTKEWEDYPWHLAAAFADEDEDAFWMPELAVALESQDDEKINEAILRFFFEEFDPQRVEEIDGLLEKNLGNEDHLFTDLQLEYHIAAPPQVVQPVPYNAKPGMSSEAKGGEEEKSSEPLAVPKRRPSYVVSGMRRQSGWEMNAIDAALTDKMVEGGAAEYQAKAVVSVATAANAGMSLPPFAPGGVRKAGD